MYYLGCMLVELRPFVILDRLLDLYGLKYDSATTVDCHCSYTLINWSVLLQLASEQDLTLIATCVFKTKVFILQNQFLATYSYIYRCLKIKFESIVCQ